MRRRCSPGGCGWRPQASGSRLETRPTGHDLAGFHDVIVATGVTPREIALPAEGGPQVISYADLLEGRAEAGDKVAIIGAGGIGVDVAEFLSAPRPSPTLDIGDLERHWGVVEADEEHRGGVTARPVEEPRREVHLLQRKETRIGAGLGRTTGWVHRAELRHARRDPASRRHLPSRRRAGPAHHRGRAGGGARCGHGGGLRRAGQRRTNWPTEIRGAREGPDAPGARDRRGRRRRRAGRRACDPSGGGGGGGPRSRRPLTWREDRRDHEDREEY